MVRTKQLQPPDQPNFDAVTMSVSTPYTPMGSPKLPLGTDELGRDVVARLARGGQVSLKVGIIVQLIAVSVGLLFSVLGTFSPKWVRLPILRFTDAMFAFPDILLAILIVGTFASSDLGLTPVIVALAITAWPSVTRLAVTQIGHGERQRVCDRCARLRSIHSLPGLEAHSASGDAADPRREHGGDGGHRAR